MLWIGFAATLVSLAINGGMDSIEGMWYAIIPVALLNQNFSVAKALFSDYVEEQGGSDADRAGAIGKLGMAVGFSFMAGPILATLLVNEYIQAINSGSWRPLHPLHTSRALNTLHSGPLALGGRATYRHIHAHTVTYGYTWFQAIWLSAAVTLLSGSLIFLMPPPKLQAERKEEGGGLVDFVNLPVLKTRGAQLLM